MKIRIPHIFTSATLRILAISALMCSSMGLTFAVEKSKNATPHQYTVVIDAGHGGNDAGAVDNGCKEKDINLGVATKLADKIKKNLKNVKAVLTRSDDSFLSLQKRAEIANQNKSDLFISIHTNSVDASNANRKSVAGASVYALGPQKDSNNLQVARRENSVIELESNFKQKYKDFDPSKDESYIIFEMAQKKTVGQSLKFADKAQKELVRTAGRGDRGVKQAGFWVLWATSMPAVLVELDFICNPDVAQFLKSEEGQEKLATALFNAVKSYFSSATAEVSKSEDTYGIQAMMPESNAEECPEDFSTLTCADAGTYTSVCAASIAAQSRSSRGSSSARKRRSTSSKKASEEKSYETNNITLKSEESYEALPLEEDKPEVKPDVDNTSKTKKTKKQKEQERKRKKAEQDAKKKQQKKEAEARAKAKKNSNASKTKGGNTTIRVEGASVSISNKDEQSGVKAQGHNRKPVKSNKNTKNSQNSSGTATPKAADVGGNSKASASKPVSKSNSGSKNQKKTDKKSDSRDKNAPVIEKTNQKRPQHREATTQIPYYTILLVESNNQVKVGDERLGGLKPTGVFIEQSKFKYYYGKSKSRQEIQDLYESVRNVVPNAQIIMLFDKD